mgnify:CR=1 FL=1
MKFHFRRLISRVDPGWVAKDAFITYGQEAMTHKVINKDDFSQPIQVIATSFQRYLKLDFIIFILEFTWDSRYIKQHEFQKTIM